MKAVGILLLLSGALVVSAQQRGPAFGRQRIHPQLQSLDDSSTEDVIVLHRDGAPADAGPMMRRTGVNMRNHFGSLGVSVARVSRRDIERLASDPDVAFVAPDQGIQAFALDKGPESVGAYQAFAQGWTGNGVGVAVIDSGLSYQNCDWGTGNTACGSSRYGAQISFVNNLNGSWTPPDDGQDAYGHGTHVASIIGGSGLFSTTFVNQWTIYPNYWIHGVAPGVNVISMRVLDQNGAGKDSSVIAALDYAVTNKSRLNIRVINLSLGRPVTVSYTQDPLCQAVERAWKAGIVVVVAAGNYGRNNSTGNQGYGTITAPGNDPYVITVGAVNTFGSTDRSQHKVTSYSSKGPTAIDHVVKPDLVAPGNKIHATQCYECQLPAVYPANKVPDTDFASVSGGVVSDWYLRLSGTSMAAPMVSGAAALLIHKNPSLTPDQVKARLMKTASKANFVKSHVAVDASAGTSYTINHDLFTVGAGELDIMAALNNTDLFPATSSAASPTAYFDTATKTVKILTGTSVVWGTNVVWGTSLVWGTTVMSGNSVVWGTTMVWGSNTNSASSVIWGTGSAISSTGAALASESSSAVLNGDK